MRFFVVQLTPQHAARARLSACLPLLPSYRNNVPLNVIFCRRDVSLAPIWVMLDTCTKYAQPIIVARATNMRDQSDACALAAAAASEVDTAVGRTTRKSEGVVQNKCESTVRPPRKWIDACGQITVK